HRHSEASPNGVSRLLRSCRPDNALQEGIMASIRVDPASLAWMSAVPFYGPQAIYDGKEIIQLKILSDRRKEGGGITWLVRFSPPPGKIIRIVAMARSDEQIFKLEGGRRATGEPPPPGSGSYGLNTQGQRHGAKITSETMDIVIYAGEPDEI